MRKFTHEGVDYEFVVGKTHTKVRRADKAQPAKLFLNSDWGTPMDSNRCAFVIRPSDVRGMLLGERNRTTYPCKYHPDITVTGLAVDPYSSEIYNADVLVPNCPKCLNQSAWDI